MKRLQAILLLIAISLVFFAHLRGSLLPLHRGSAETREPKTELLEHGVLARASTWNQPFPCLEPDEAMKRKFGYRAPATSGLLFLKIIKVGGSTATGISMRIAKHVAERRDESFWICRGRWDHSYAFKLLEHRDRSQSFTWTVLREPTKRAVSEFYHFQVSRENRSDDDSSFIKYLTKESRSSRNLYLNVLSLEKNLFVFDDVPAIINQILSDYDFIGITERMDESAVVLMMLLDARMGDILYLNAKGKGDSRSFRSKKGWPLPTNKYNSPIAPLYFFQDTGAMMMGYTRTLAFILNQVMSRLLCANFFGVTGGSRQRNGTGCCIKQQTDRLT